MEVPCASSEGYINQVHMGLVCPMLKNFVSGSPHCVSEASGQPLSGAVTSVDILLTPLWANECVWGNAVIVFTFRTT